MRLNAVKRSLAVLVSGGALFLTLGAGCEGGGGDGDDNPGVENTQDNEGDNGGDEQDGDQGDDQDGDEGN
ncbi:hypothetical protein ACFP3R_33700 [Saccharothrix lopnurensis]|uniref:DNA primase n=1 Tax=Saccharothrix lopnurensis TaxID=1670621 RepID=A0ABW1PGP0_9PSEU